MNDSMRLFRSILGCLLLPFCCAALKPYTPVTADPLVELWRWRHEESLAGLGVLCMDEAADGTLWFGNAGSIATYDGKNVTVIPFDEELLSAISHGRKTPWANALIVLRDGNVLALIGKSLVLRTNNTWRVVLKDAGPSVFTARMEQAADGSIWVIVPEALWRIDKDLSDVSRVLKASERHPLLSFCIDSSGSVWVVKKTGALSSRLIKIPVPDGQPADRSEWSEFPVAFDNDTQEADLIFGDNGLLWYTAKSSGVEAFDSRSCQWLRRESKIKSQNYYSLLKRGDGSIWAGGESKLLRMVQGKDTLYTAEQLNLPMLPMSLYETSGDRVWVIGRIGSVYSVDVGTREWTTCQGLNYQCETPDGFRWFSTTMHRSVVSHNVKTGEWIEYGTDDGVIDSTLTMIRSSHGLIWAVGSHEDRAAFAVFDGKVWTRFCHPDLLRRFESEAVLEAADGTVWLGTGGDVAKGNQFQGGVVQYRVNPDRSVELLARHAPPDFPHFVTALAQTADGVLWVGSTVTYRYDGVIPQAQPAGAVQGTRTIAMRVDSNQTVWLAKDCYGVCRWQGDAWQVFGMNEGLPSLNIRSMCLLQDGSIMVSSDKGISRFDGDIWTAKAYPEWFRMIQRKSEIKQSGDGAIWLNYVDNEPQFAQISEKTGGFSTVRHQPETAPPETQIVHYLKRVAPPGNCHIEWSGHDLWSTTSSEDLQYSWRLDGREWSHFSVEKNSTFLELASGTHALEVRARDSAFNVDPTPARIEFFVIPPVWRQPWFLSMVFVFIGLIALLTWLLFRLRERFLLEKQKQHEKNLIERQAERENHLLEMDRVKTGFFTNISHELRTPLTVILGPLEMMLKSEVDPKKKRMLLLMIRNAQRVTGLVTQLLDFRKIEEGKIRIEATSGDLVPVVSEVVASLQPLAENAQIDCFLESVPECRGWFDFDKLQKIFTNLIANSIKYTKPDGEIHVSLRMTSQDATGQDAPEKRILTFTVEDTGIGIAKEHIDRIFDRFYRVSENAMAQGAGIGLNLTKELVDILGGEIRVESPIHPDDVRPGTRFTVRLPVEEVARGEGRGVVESVVFDQSDLSDRSDRTSQPCDSASELPLILIVEDDADIRGFIVEGLSSEYRMETAKNGEVGLRMAKELVPDLVVTDVMMPVMDGMTLCRELKTSMETSHIPVIMLTAKTAVESQIKGLRTGADDYITKPFHMAVLQARINNLLESRRLLREKFCREYTVLTPKLPENTPEKEFFDAVMAVIEENYADETFTPDSLASLLNMGLRTLQRKFKAVTDRTPSDLIGEYRMTRAAELLKGTTYSVAEITYQVGYTEPNNFYRMFKKQFDVSPSQYRADHHSS